MVCLRIVSIFTLSKNTHYKWKTAFGTVSILTLSKNTHYSYLKILCLRIVSIITILLVNILCSPSTSALVSPTELYSVIAFFN